MFRNLFRPLRATAAAAAVALTAAVPLAAHAAVPGQPSGFAGRYVGLAGADRYDSAYGYGNPYGCDSLYQGLSGPYDGSCWQDPMFIPRERGFHDGGYGGGRGHEGGFGGHGGGFGGHGGGGSRGGSGRH